MLCYNNRTQGHLKVFYFLKQFIMCGSKQKFIKLACKFTLQVYFEVTMIPVYGTDTPTWKEPKISRLITAEIKFLRSREG
jgi:hypothetical protein